MRSADCLVVGGGLAGTALSMALFRRSLSGIIIDRIGLGGGASGNPRGLALLDTGRIEQPIERDRIGFAALLDNVSAHEAAGYPLESVRGPVIQFPVTDRLQARMRAERVSVTDLNVLSGCVCGSDGLLLDGIALNPLNLCRAHAGGSQAEVIVDTVKSLVWSGEVWRAYGSGDRLLATARLVCIANAADAMAVYQTAWLKLERVRGQIALIPPDAQGLPHIPICFDGYILPIPRGGFVVGADYDHISADSREHPGVRRMLMKRLSRWIAIPPLEHLPLRGRVAFRASTHDRQPYIGPVPDYDQFRRRARDALRARRPVAACDALLDTLPYLPNCFVSVGHGSRGLISAHYAAEVLADYIAADHREEPPGAIDISVHPRRLLARLLKDLRGAR